MRAAVVTAFDRPLTLEERTVPATRAGRGSCTDGNQWPVPHRHPRRTWRLAGEADSAVRSGARRRRHRHCASASASRAPRLGERVAIPWLGWACGECEWCIKGWETLCPHQVNTGYGRDGNVLRARCRFCEVVVAVPHGIDPLDAAPLTCAGVTTYKAVKVAKVGPSDVVAVFGVGGLGHMAVQYARIAGATVVAIDIHEDKLDMARKLGATHTDQCRDRGSLRCLGRARRGGCRNRHRGHPGSV